MTVYGSYMCTSSGPSEPPRARPHGGEPAEPAGVLLGALDALAAEDVTGLPDAALRAELPVLLAAVNRLHAEVVRRVAAFDTRELAGLDGCRTAKSWLRAFGRLSGPTANSVVKAGRLLRHLPDVAATAAAGDASAEHLARLTRLTDRVGVDRVTDLDSALAGAASQLDPGDFGRICDRVRAHFDPDGPEPDPHKDFQRRGITLSPFDGMVLVHGQLDPEGGAALRTAIDALTVPPAAGDPRTPAQRRADALVELARRALTAGALPTVGGVRPQLAVLVTPEHLIAPRPGADATGAAPTGVPAAGPPPSGRSVAEPSAARGVTAGGTAEGCSAVRTTAVGSQSELPTGPPPPWLEWFGDIPTTTAQRLACDADVWRIVLDPASGQPVDVGRAHRLVPHWIRKALWARDRRCRFPGCHAPTAWTDAHHLNPWQYGGRTDVTNLALLCRYHHALVHEGGWRIRLDRHDGSVRATRPDGRPYEVAPSVPWSSTPETGGTPPGPPPTAAPKPPSSDPSSQVA